MSIARPILSVPLREEYYKRLSTPYTKGGKEFIFLEQFNAGSGNELSKKFWRTISSSRLCFDLYSWMGADDNYDALEFEKRIPGIISGGRQISPNMDVYFEMGQDIFFIESKYTETVVNKNYKKDLPEAYWNTNETYRSVNGKTVPFPIIKRYHGYEDVKDAFISFIDEVDSVAAQEEGPSWFDAKQETCHLLGITIYAIKNHPRKSIHFLNVAANESFSMFSAFFNYKAEEMVSNILKNHGVSASFDYQLCSVDDFFGSFRLFDRQGYQSKYTIRQLITNPELYDIENHPICR